jgi:glycosyltransferase involved in cell wall biosynthesis
LNVLWIGNFLSRHGRTPTSSEELVRRLRDAGWTVTATSSVLSRPLRVLDMQRQIRTGSHDVAQIDVYSGWAFRWAELAAWSLKRRGVPYVLTLHGGRLPELAERAPERLRRLLTGARTVTAPSRFMRDATADLDAAVEILPNGLDLSSHVYRPRAPALTLVWLRAFHQVYRPELAVRVLARLAVRHPAVRLLMVGPDKGDGSLAATRRLAADLGIGDRVEITGGVPKSEVPARLDQGDVFLNTSDIDNAPVSVLEAMASGLAVVSTDAGGIRHLLDDGEDSLVVPRGDDEALANAVERLLDQPGLAERLGAAARRRAEAFDWGRVLPRWEDVLRRSAPRGLVR